MDRRVLDPTQMWQFLADAPDGLGGGLRPAPLQDTQDGVAEAPYCLTRSHEMGPTVLWVLSVWVLLF